MRRLFYLTLAAALIVSACATAPTATAPPASAPTQVVESAPTVAPTSAPVIKTEFTPTDPTTVNLALGKPQFVEFFAFW